VVSCFVVFAVCRRRVVVVEPSSPFVRWAVWLRSSAFASRGIWGAAGRLEPRRMLDMTAPGSKLLEGILAA
jgi:hypothetical protein